MFRIRGIYDDVSPANEEAIAQVPARCKRFFLRLLVLESYSN